MVFTTSLRGLLTEPLGQCHANPRLIPRRWMGSISSCSNFSIQKSQDSGSMNQTRALCGC
jgi:hypothetical protein